MHIAIVEDELKLAETLKEGLEAEAYQVSLFSDGREAEEEFLKNPGRYELIILDLTLPRKSGFEVCRTLREHGVVIPILILTARDTTADKVRALDSGADDFLTKPFAFEELVARLRALARRSSQTPGVLTVRDLVLDPKSRSVRRGNASITLTPTEYELLALLMRERGRVLSREEISAALWDVRDSSLSNIVDVHLSNLRKKIDADYEEKRITTVRGMGYQISE